MVKALRLEKRGNNFWSYSDEIKESNLENYRLYGKLTNQYNEVFSFEIITHEYPADFCSRLGRPNGTYSHIECFAYNEKGCVRYTPHPRKMKYYYTEPTKECVLDWINKWFETDFDCIEIVDNL